jgi:hypothetical protein
MFPNFKDIIKAVVMAGLVLGAAIGFASSAKAGPLDQGPHILITTGYGIQSSTTVLEIYGSKEECLAVRDSLIKEYGKTFGILACIPGRNT